ncbi:replicative DNA helicase [Pasteurella oralis]|uniref:replicative DNA helicase n=1 Tax=Pasteurella oralis TaxID=1071947 RepID=UPI000C7E393C|nr:replicative DNA helicase [Pasteurella oralis]
MKNTTYDLEYSLIGSFLAGGLTAQAREVMTWLEPEMFATYQLGSMYNNIRKQARKDNVIDIILLHQDFGEDFANLAEIVKNTITPANLTGYAYKVRSFWVNRTAQKTMLEMAAKLSQARDEQAEKITEKALSEMQKLLSSKVEVKPIVMGELVDEYIDVLEKRSKQDFNSRLLHTGIEAVDNILGGINPTDIVVIAGRPGMGKTEFALTLTRNIAEQKGAVLFFSLEMANQQLMDRILSANANVPVRKLRNPNSMDQTEFGRVGDGLGKIKDHRIYFVDRGGLSANEIVSITENHLSNTGPLSAICIDYLGLMNHGSLKNANKSQLIEDSLSTLKTFAKNFNVPIILLSQLNREVDSRSDKRPQNSDLRDSGSIEQDASQIIMLYREKAYKKDSDNDYSEAIITKNRFGELGTAYMKFDKGHFVDCDQALAYQFANEKPAQQMEFKNYARRGAA